MTSKFLLTATAIGLFGAAALAAPVTSEERPAPDAVEAPKVQLSSDEIATVLSSAATLPPNCEAFYFPDPVTGEPVCSAVVCQEDNPLTPWFDPESVFYECSEFGL